MLALSAFTLQTFYGMHACLLGGRRLEIEGAPVQSENYEATAARYATAATRFHYYSSDRDANFFRMSLLQQILIL